MKPLTLLAALLPLLLTLTMTHPLSDSSLLERSSDSPAMLTPTRARIRSILSLLSVPSTDEFFTHVRDDVHWTVTGKSFLSGVWTTKASYRAATFAKIGTLVKPPGIKLNITQGEEGIIVGQHGWATADLFTVDTYTNSGVLYNQSYAWHMRFDDAGLIAEVKVWLDTLTLENVLGAEAAKQNGTTGSATEKLKV